MENRGKRNKYCSRAIAKVNEYKEIDSEIKKTAYLKAWSIASMDGHGASNRTVKYLGSSIGCPTTDGKGFTMADYYLDNAGEYWYDVRVLLSTGEIISMEEHIFK